MKPTPLPNTLGGASLPCLKHEAAGSVFAVVPQLFLLQHPEGFAGEGAGLHARCVAVRIEGVGYLFGGGGEVRDLGGGQVGGIEDVPELFAREDVAPGVVGIYVGAEDGAPVGVPAKRRERCSDGPRGWVWVDAAGDGAEIGIGGGPDIGGERGDIPRGVDEFEHARHNESARVRVSSECRENTRRETRESYISAQTSCALEHCSKIAQKKVLTT
ncbi:MAG: hypothetical protein KatS3mg054_0360 [Chloroflexus sp.]|nr:MAG: hypothetical protein KatS3mg054_0360 [Chloroflexus sp.]